MEEQKFYAAAIIMAGLAASVSYQEYSSRELALLAASGADRLYEIFKRREDNGQ